MFDIENLASAWKGHRRFAKWLVEEMQPTTIVDLGVDYGYSTFCLAIPNIGTVYGIDTFEGDIHTGVHTDAKEVCYYVIEQNNYNNIKIIEKDFDLVHSEWTLPIDILHIDGLHTYEQTMNNYKLWSKFLHEKSCVIMHDVISFPEVMKVFQEIPLYKVHFTHSAGLGVLSADKELIEKIIKVYAK